MPRGEVYPRRTGNIGVFNERDHRKLVVIDGRVLCRRHLHRRYVGWGEASDKEHFADISVRVRGPIVHSVQSAFSENWAGETVSSLWATTCSLHSSGGRRDDPRRMAEAGRLGPCSQDPSSHGHLPRTQAHLDTESIFHSGTRSERGFRCRSQAGCRCAGDDAFDRGIRQSDGAARGPPKFREAFEMRRAHFRVPQHAAASEVMSVEAPGARSVKQFRRRSFETNDEISWDLRSRDSRAVEEICKGCLQCRDPLEKWSKRSLGHRLIDNLYYLLTRCCNGHEAPSIRACPRSWRAPGKGASRHRSHAQIGASFPGFYRARSPKHDAAFLQSSSRFDCSATRGSCGRRQSGHARLRTCRAPAIFLDVIGASPSVASSRIARG